MNDSKTPRRRATYEDIVRLPEHVVGELIDGELIVSPRPAIPHVIAGSVLGANLLPPFQLGISGPGGWWILNEPELHFGEDVLVPDLAGWREERAPRSMDRPYMTVAPDWLCEVLSPSTTQWDRGRKLEIYGHEGVRHVWFVDPRARTLEVLTLDGDRLTPATAFRDSEVVRAAPFEAVEVALAHLWGARSGAGVE